MNADDKLTAILRSEADQVEPSAAGWDAIRAGIDARRRRLWWLRGSAASAALLAVVGLVVFLPRNHDPDRLVQPPVGSDSVSPSQPAVTSRPVAAIWPFRTTAEVADWKADPRSRPALSSPSGTAQAFAAEFLHLTGATVASSDVVGDDLFFTVQRQVTGSSSLFTVTTAVVRRYDGGPYLVVAAQSDAMSFVAPVPGSTVTSPLAAHGTYHAVDPAFTVALAGGSARATNSPPNVWTATVPFTPTGGTEVLSITNPSLADTGIGQYAAIPVVTGDAPEAQRPSTFVGIQDGRVAVFSVASGTLVRYLSPAGPGGGASSPEVSPDGRTVVYAQGAGTCAAALMAVPVIGGTPTTLVPATDGAVDRPAYVGPTRIAYVLHPAPGCTGAELRVLDTRDTAPQLPPVTLDADLRGEPAWFGTTGIAYVTGADTTTLTLRDSRVRTVDAEPGCMWLAVASNLRTTGLLGAEMCGSHAALVDVDPATDTVHRVLAFTDNIAVSRIDYDPSGGYVLVWRSGASVTGPVQVWVADSAYQPADIAQGPLSPAW